jgi:transposase/predicted nucleic acid-binding Zn finger protein
MSSSKGNAMTPREERGLVIAATQKLTQKGKVWLVPSQNGKGKYTVCPDHDSPYCSCPDHAETNEPCKHIFAVRVTMQREQAKDGTVTETKTVTFTEKKTYRQEWGIYNLAQAEEKRRFLALLYDLCRGLPNPPPQPKGGRTRTDMSDMVFMAVYKVYSMLSGRRFCTDVEEAFEKGYLTRKVNGMMVWAFMESPLLAPVLERLITVSSLPLRAVESVFAPDSTGFSTSRFIRWTDEKYGTRSGRDWVKAHCMAGTRTHVITAVEILDRDAADSPQFKALVKKTAEHFTIKEVPADKAYLSRENLELVHNLGGTAYIPFKVNSVHGEPGTVWEKMFHYYSMHREDFERHYHQRSNAESVFSMLKAKFRDHVRSKADVAMKNEVLCKVLAHNICCVIMSQLELGIEADFWADSPAPTVEPETIPVEVTATAVQMEEPVAPPASTRYQMCAGA